MRFRTLIPAAALCGVATASLQAENLLVPLHENKWNEQTAAHLLRRAAFEGTPALIDKLLTMSLADAVDYLIEYDKIDEPEYDLQLDPKLSRRPPRTLLKEFDEQTRQRYVQTHHRSDYEQLERIRAWWLERMIASPRQLQEKMTLFWHGHFTSGYRKVRSSYQLYRQNELLRAHALGNFRELLLRISTDPAMLVYLDSIKNNKFQPNENYARELMELFTLGEGHYTEFDIKEAARAFTGWSLQNEEFKFRRRQHDYGLKVFLGQEGKWNGGDIIDIILSQEQAQRFIVTRLWEFFCYEEPDRAVVNGLAHLFRESKFEIKPVVRKILMSRGFYSEKARGRQIKSPVHVVVGTIRLLGVEQYDARALVRSLASMGQQLFQPPSVKGWDGGVKWINTATVFHRYNFCGRVVNGHRGRPRRAAMMSMRQGASEFGFMEPPEPGQIGQPPFDPMPLMIRHQLERPEDIVRFFGDRLLAVPLAGEHHDALVTLLKNTAGNPDPGNRKYLDGVRTVIHLIMSSPENQLY